MEMIDVSIILVNYKTYDMTKNIIIDIIDKSNGFNYEVIVVDNSCDEIKFQNLKKDFINYSFVKFIDSKKNLGFGNANNLGAKVARGRYLFFLNTDTKLINNAIYELYDFIDNSNNCGICGSNLFSVDEKPAHSFYPYKKNIFNEVYTNSIFLSFIFKFKKKRFDFNYRNFPQKIKGYVCGASLMIRKELFDKIGGFDKDIFMYAEEALLCFEIINKYNKDIYNIPTSKIIHFEGESFKKQELSSSFNYNREKMIVDGNYLFYYKSYGYKKARKYIKTFYKLFKFKSIFWKLINHNKYFVYSNKSKIYKSKWEEIK